MYAYPDYSTFSNNSLLEAFGRISAFLYYEIGNESVSKETLINCYLLESELLKRMKED